MKIESASLILPRTLVLGLVLVLAACAPVVPQSPADPSPTPPPAAAATTAPALPQTGSSPTAAASPTARPSPTSSPSPTLSPSPQPSPTPPPAASPTAPATGEPGDSPAAETVQISVMNAGFSPEEVTVSPGTTVVWTQDSSFPHTVTADDGQFNSGRMANGDTFEFTFSEPGRYPYYCSIHGGPGGIGMAGVIIVEGSPGAASRSTGEAGGGEADYPVEYPGDYP